jgi:hypothetical protein
MTTMTARYRSRCYSCQGHIVPGDKIVVQGRRRTVHDRCADNKADAILLSSGVRIWRNRNGRCEDAPCCGCCD